MGHKVVLDGLQVLVFFDNCFIIFLSREIPFFSSERFFSTLSLFHSLTEHSFYFSEPGESFWFFPLIFNSSWLFIEILAWLITIDKSRRSTTTVFTVPYLYRFNKFVCFRGRIDLTKHPYSRDIFRAIHTGINSMRRHQIWKWWLTIWKSELRCIDKTLSLDLIEKNSSQLGFNVHFFF